MRLIGLEAHPLAILVLTEGEVETLPLDHLLGELPKVPYRRPADRQDYVTSLSTTLQQKSDDKCFGSVDPSFG